jgi:hypothetical protein
MICMPKMFRNLDGLVRSLLNNLRKKTYFSLDTIAYK